MSRVDLGGITLQQFDIRAPKAPNAALSGDRLAVDLNWASLFSPQPSFVAGDTIVMRVDLTGTRPVLGDLDAAVKAFTKPGGKPGPLPKLDFKTIRIIGDTPLGPVEAKGAVAATGPDAFVITMNAPAAKLALYGAELDLKGADLNATVKDGAISAKMTLGLDTFRAGGAIISDVKIDASLDQTAGVLRGQGQASLGEVQIENAKLARTEAKATVESAAVDPAAFDFDAWLRQVRTLTLNASAGAGSVGEIGWKTGLIKADVAPRATGGSGGDFSFDVSEMKAKPGSADRLEIKGTVEIPATGRPRIAGQALVHSATLTAAQRNDLADAASDPFEAALPGFASALKRAADKAGQAFDVTAPWSLVQTETGYDIAALSGARISAASGFTLTADAPPGKTEAVTWSTDEGGRWKAEGSLRATGGGAPTLQINLARATGVKETVAMAGAAKLQPWRVGDDVLSAEAAGLTFDTTDKGGVAGGQLTLNLNGGLGGGVWKAARATGEIKTAWGSDTFYADAPRGLVIQWDEGRYGTTVFGAGALHYTPRGRLAELKDKAVIGQGDIAKVSLPIKASGFSAKAAVGATAINWRAEGGVRIGFDAAPTTIDLDLAGRTTPVSINDITGILDIRNGWKVTGGFKGASVKAPEASVADLAAKFDIGGVGDDLSGSLSSVAMRIFDPNPEETRRYEEAKFEGSARLKSSVADFSGIFTSTKKSVQIANVSGQHSLKTGAGSLSFAPTPLVFLPRTFQPSDLSPLLRGPANVTGRADIGGAASWSADGFKSSGNINLNNVGFSLASAGIFEGVSGKVEVFDLLGMRSAPGQTISLGKVTFGLPIEKGVVRFQLIGYDAIRIEGAEWPFVGGRITVKPVDFKFGGDEDKRIVAHADKWDLNTIVEKFEIPDVKLKGTVSGDIPVVFSTGSARIDKAELQASEDGGVIQFLGSVGQAAAESDANAKMLFDALKDFRYQVLKVGVNGDITGWIVLSVDLLGRNPTVLDGAPFQLGISIDSELMQLANKAQGRFSLQDALTGGLKGAVSGGTVTGAPN
ncbi:MAG TPA: YdbH domain-containing protein [Hyphomonadaceae bacterium]|nr:YdbH domain-containing protein [Hyphomonadaceae bacterium]